MMAIQSIRNPNLDLVMAGLSFLGNKGWFWILAGLILMVNKKTRLCGFTVLLSLIAMLIICNLGLKPLVQRPRPCWKYEVDMVIACLKDYSFPSGHTYSAFAAAVPVFINNKKHGVLLLSLGGLIAFSRLYLFMHWPTDVLAGMLLGIINGIIATYFITGKSEQLNKFLKIY